MAALEPDQPRRVGFRSLGRQCWAIFLVAGCLQAAHPSFRLFTTADGLVRNWINQIRRDSRGYLWFCTVEGISLFDGYRFTSFTTRDGLPGRLVTDILETRGGEYLIATTEGIARFYPIARGSAGHFQNFRLGPSKAANEVDALLQDSEGAIWCATRAGLYRLHPSDQGMGPEFISLDPGRTLEVSSLLEDSFHRIWAASSNGVFLRARDGSVEHLGPECNVPSELNALVMDSHGHVWAGGIGLTELIPNAHSATGGAHYTQINGRRLGVFALTLARNGDIWIATNGLIRFRADAAPGERFHGFAGIPALSFLDIFSLAFDAQDNLWMGVSTLGAGRISREPSELFSEADGLEKSSPVVGFLEDRRGKFYAVSGATRILNELIGDRFEPRPRRLPSGIINMGWGQGAIALQDHEGHWWFASGTGLLHYPPADDARGLAHSIPHVYTKRDGLPDNVILRLFEDSRGDIWAGTSTGVACWHRATGHWTAYVPPGASLTSGLPAVHAIAEDRSGAIWVGFAAPGMLRIRDSKAEVIRAGVPSGFINALLVDQRGRLWIGSSQGGLGRMDQPDAALPGIQTLTMSQGLSSDHLFALAEDRWGRIYIAGGRGVDRLTVETDTIRRFTEASGLPGGETERLYRDRNGAIWFASNFGIARYYPEPDVVSSPPAPLLRGLKINGAPYPLSVLGERSLGGLELAPRENGIEIEYRSLHFAPGERLRYQYRLAGASEQWSTPDEVQTVQYANLSPGRYRFEVRSIGETGLGSAPAVFEFHLLPPFWKQGWFAVLMASLLAVSAYGLHHYRLNQLLRVERVRTRLATDLHDDLGAGLAEIAILSEVAKRKPAGNQEALEHVAERARGMRASLSDIVWTVDPARDRLADLIRRMRETTLVMLESGNRNVQFFAPADEEMERTELPPDLRRHLFLFLKESVTNIARHAGATAAAVEVSVSAGRLRLLIRDNGCGFDPQAPVTGRGLASLRYRATEMRGELRLKSAPGQGTEIELHVPLPA
jgi:signal transduction histidine kinase/ligand-binding sensor domain-containing protein